MASIINSDNISVNSANPDAFDLAAKIPVDISFNPDDLAILEIDARIESASLRMDADQRTPIIQVQTIDTPLTGSQYYFTPEYTVILNYAQWLGLNRNFTEL